MARFTPFYQEHFLTLRVLPVTTGRHLCTGTVCTGKDEEEKKKHKIEANGCRPLQ